MPDSLGPARRRAGVVLAIPLVVLALREVGRPAAHGLPREHCSAEVWSTASGLQCTPTPTLADWRQALFMGRRLDINRAPPEALTIVPGIGAKLSCRIVADRRRNGRFRRVFDTQRVKGIGPRLVARIADYADVYAPGPAGRISRASSGRPSPCP